MADKEKKAEKPAKPAKQDGKDKQEKPGKQAKPPKGGEAAEGQPKAAKAKAAEKPAAPAEPVGPPRLRKHYDDVVRKRLVEQFGYKNPMQVPAIDKVVINMGIGEGVNDRKKVESAAADLGMISGQKAVITKSRKSIANFKLRENQQIGRAHV